MIVVAVFIAVLFGCYESYNDRQKFKMGINPGYPASKNLTTFLFLDKP